MSFNPTMVVSSVGSVGGPFLWNTRLVPFAGSQVGTTAFVYSTCSVVCNAHSISSELEAPGASGSSDMMDGDLPLPDLPPEDKSWTVGAGGLSREGGTRSPTVFV